MRCELGVGPKFEPNKFGGVGKRKAYNLPHRYHRLNTSYLGRGAQHARGRTGVHSLHLWPPSGAPHGPRPRVSATLSPLCYSLSRSQQDSRAAELRAVWRALLETGASHRIEGEHLERGRGRLVQRRAAALQETHQRLHPTRLRHLLRVGVGLWLGFGLVAAACATCAAAAGSKARFLSARAAAS